MSYFVLKFRGGPWDGQELQQEVDPTRIELCVLTKDDPSCPAKSLVWAYEPWVREGVNVEMKGQLKGI